jgi:glycosidase
MGKSVVSLEYQQVYNAFFNLIRFLSLAKTDHRKQKIAAALIMTYPGVPSVYYGDEKVIEGMNLSDSTRKMI